MLRTRDDDQLSEIFTHNINARNARNVQYSLKWKVFGTFRHCGLQTARSVPRWRGLTCARTGDLLSTGNGSINVARGNVPRQ
jgi:hypothetical protein